ncbi:hypothetical protein ALC56_00882 [Trachymyrmex septentrionalis]|uniref:Uncharacterized protein n=1 Tax=Trachymyrmex septentrionalis TaxID=34720 RepID=A0A195FWT1_9HYME|nr:hypothetical protein ALC56_00882 [Trachymyrmex septentrionalis]
MKHLVNKIQNTKFTVFIGFTSDIYKGNIWMIFQVRYVDSETLDVRSQLVELMSIDVKDFNTDKLFIVKDLEIKYWNIIKNFLETVCVRTRSANNLLFTMCMVETNAYFLFDKVQWLTTEITTGASSGSRTGRPDIRERRRRRSSRGAPKEKEREREREGGGKSRGPPVMPVTDGLENARAVAAAIANNYRYFVGGDDNDDATSSGGSNAHRAREFPMAGAAVGQQQLVAAVSP